MIHRRRLACAFAAAATIAGCGGGGAHHGSAAQRAELESRLRETSVGVCDGDCQTFHAKSARCTGGGTSLDGRIFYRCRVEYHGGRLEPDVLCAALDEGRSYVARPRKDC